MNEGIKDVARDFVGMLENGGLPSDRVLDEFPTDPEARELVRDLLSISTFRGVKRNCKTLRRQSWIIAVVGALAVIGAVGATNLSLDVAVVSGIVTGGVGLVVAAIAQR